MASHQSSITQLRLTEHEFRYWMKVGIDSLTGCDCQTATGAKHSKIISSRPSLRRRRTLGIERKIQPSGRGGNSHRGRAAPATGAGAGAGAGAGDGVDGSHVDPPPPAAPPLPPPCSPDRKDVSVQPMVSVAQEDVWLCQPSIAHVNLSK